MKFIPFSKDMLDDGAKLLSTNHRLLRTRGLSLLPQRFEDPDVARQALQAVLAQPKTMGLAAIMEGKLIAYLIGTPTVNSIRGRHVWIHPAGLGIDPTQSLDLFRDLYAQLGTLWVRNGFFDHFVQAFAEQAWLEPWLKLGFAYEQAHALHDLENFGCCHSPRNLDLVIRQATGADRRLVQSFSKLIPQAHAGSPVWGVALPEDLSEINEGYGELLDEQGTSIWLAFLGERPVGIHVYRTWKDGGTDLLIPNGATRLTVASTVEDARGLGVSGSLLAVGLEDARSKGFRFCETDWRVTHLLSSRHWPRRGFVPVAYRLVRKVDQRIVWANGYNEL